MEDAQGTLAVSLPHHERAEVQRRQREYRALGHRRKNPDHAKLMGLTSKAKPEEVGHRSILMPIGTLLPAGMSGADAASCCHAAWSPRIVPGQS